MAPAFPTDEVIPRYLPSSGAVAGVRNRAALSPARIYSVLPNTRAEPASVARGLW